MNKKLKPVLLILLIAAILSLLICLILSYFSTDMKGTDYLIIFAALMPINALMVAMYRNIIHDLRKVSPTARKYTLLISAGIILFLIINVAVTNHWSISLSILYSVIPAAGIIIGCMIYRHLFNRYKNVINAIGECINNDSLNEALEKIELLKHGGRYPIVCRGFIYYNLYLCYLHMENVQRAQEVFCEGSKYIKRIANRQIYPHLLVLNAYEELINENYDQCRAYLDKARKSAEKHGIDVQNDLYKLIEGRLYAQQNMSMEARNILIPLRTFCQAPVIQSRTADVLKRLKEIDTRHCQSNIPGV